MNEAAAAGAVVPLRLSALTDCWNRTVVVVVVQTSHSSSLMMHRLRHLGQSTPSDAGFPP